ncbi:hypothetical protein BC936DRAFT_141311 [Jimgerdemannia flammicorona]|uniref:Uncharacterized protein n=1 Tax=Jimgerdemannia flammicorona TaxID=994334 RepID=A0A433A2G4_9FUNG|nr:hypothetical protein BC936DRAFT_141311 [Jimgerdemannia flammicorona]
MEDIVPDGKLTKSKPQPVKKGRYEDESVDGATKKSVPGKKDRKSGSKKEEDAVGEVNEDDGYAVTEPALKKRLGRPPKNENGSAEKAKEETPEEEDVLGKRKRILEAKKEGQRSNTRLLYLVFACNSYAAYQSQHQVVREEVRRHRA